MINRSENPAARKGLTSRSPAGWRVAAVEIAVRLSPAVARPALAALFALDARLADLVESTSEPVIGQLRLAWWSDSLRRLDDAPASAEPVLRQVQRDVLPQGITGATLAQMTDGWEELVVASVIDHDTLSRYAASGGRLFAAGQVVLGGDQALAAVAGEGWALANLAIRTRNAADGILARTMAEERLSTVFTRRWPVALRPLGVLALLTEFELQGGPARLRHFFKLLRFRSIGR